MSKDRYVMTLVEVTKFVSDDEAALKRLDMRVDDDKWTYFVIEARLAVNRRFLESKLNPKPKRPRKQWGSATRKRDSKFD